MRRNGALRESYRYDLAGNLVEKLDGEGRPLVAFTIGKHNLKAERRLSSGARHTYEYDERGRMTRIDGDGGELTFEYDAAGALTRDLRDGVGVVHAYAGTQGWSTTVLDRFVTTYRHHG